MESGAEDSKEWREQHSSLSDQLWYMYQNDICPNLEIVVSSDQKQKIYKCHQLVVARICSEFESMIKNCAKDGDNNNFIHLKISNPDLFHQVLRFAYTDMIEFSSVLECLDVLDLCFTFKIQKLKKLCEAYLSKQVDINSVWDVLDRTQTKGRLTDWSKSVIGKSTFHCLQSEKFLFCKESTLLALLEMEFLNISEVELVKAVLRWLQHHLGEQPFEPALAQEMLGPCLQHIRFLTLTPTEFTEHVTKSGLFSTEDCLAILINLACPVNTPLPSFICKNTVQRKRPEIANKKDQVPNISKGGSVENQKMEPPKKQANTDQKATSGNRLTTLPPTNPGEPAPVYLYRQIVNLDIRVRFLQPFEVSESIMVNKSVFLEAVCIATQVNNEQIGKKYNESVHIMVNAKVGGKQVGYQTYHGPAPYSVDYRERGISRHEKCLRVPFTNHVHLQAGKRYVLKMIFRKEGTYDCFMREHVKYKSHLIANFDPPHLQVCSLLQALVVRPED